MAVRSLGLVYFDLQVFSTQRWDVLGNSEILYKFYMLLTVFKD